MKNRLEIQAEIHLLIAIGEVREDEKASEELRDAYLSWYPDSVEKHTPGYELYQRLQTNYATLKVGYLKSNFERNWSPEFLEHSIDKLRTYLVSTLPALPKDIDLPTYKKAVFKTFLWNSLPAEPNKKFFDDLKRASKDIGFSDLEYTILLSQAALDPRSNENLINNNVGLDNFRNVEKGIAFGTFLLAAPAMLLQLGIVSKLIPSLAPPEGMAYPMDNRIWGVTNIAFCLLQLKADQSEDKHKALLLATASLLQTSMLCYLNRHSQTLQCVIAGFGLAKATLVLCTPKILEYAAAPAER